jgi:hypothetical protein
MNNRKFERAARLNRFKAIFLTAAFHVGIIAAIGTYSNGSLTDYIPDTVKDWVGMDETEEQAEASLPQP